MRLSKDQEAAIIGDVAREIGTPPPRASIGSYVRWAPKKGGDPDAFLRVYPDREPPVIHFGDWANGVSVWKPLSEMVALSPDELRQLREQAKTGEAESAKFRADARKQMLEEWSAADPDGSNAYIVNKGLLDHRAGVRFIGKELIVPVQIDGKIISYQRILPNGSKLFRKGCSAKGGYFVFGALDGAETIMIGEGWATIVAASRSTGYPAIAALSKGNLKSVALHIKRRFPKALLVILADDDHKRELAEGRNLGIVYASEAADAADAILAIPKFDRTICPDGTDFWDMATFHGDQSVRDAIEGAIEGEPMASDGKTEAPPPSVDETREEIARLAGLDRISYDQQREKAAERLGIRAATLDKAVADERKACESADAEMCADVEPHDYPVNGAELLSEIKAMIERHVICTDSVTTAVALWAAFTWVIDHVNVAPIGVIHAPEKRCGKSVLLELISEFSRRALPASNISSAAMYRVIEEHKPTLLLDEADAFFRENEDLRGIVNSGHTRKMAFVIRCDGDKNTPKRFSTWGAKCFAGIGTLAPTIMDRSITFELRRKLTTEKVDSLRHVDPRVFDGIRRKLARLAEDYGATVGLAQPKMPKGINDRTYLNWEPLVAIADVAGGDWPEMARKALIAIEGSGAKELSHGEELLLACRDAFEQRGTDRLTRDELLDILTSDTEAPWATLNRGRPMTASQLRQRLKKYGIEPKPHKFGYETKRGFLTKQFAEAWARYLDGNAESYSFEGVTVTENVTDSTLNINGKEPLVTKLHKNPEGGEAKSARREVVI
ncbi:MAG: DUF3631 domain-containing protein [Hyphomicrobiales bacterium]|nr:MAG: DUF3631 domain-containing protein [Hyphomicrobiales bacterium]